jgi:ClpP class serine protease
LANELLRLTQSLYNKPHLVTGAFLNEIIPFLETRNTEGKAQLAVVDTLTPKSRELLYNPDTQIGYVSMEGPLTYLQYYGLCGPSGPSYQTIRDEVGQMLKAGAKYIVLDQDSPGGEAYMAFETARHIREQADKYGAKIIAYVDGLSASASYVFSAVADEVIMNPQAEVGSIGVVVKLRNMNEAMKKMGVEDTYVYAGDSKVPFDSEGKFSEGFLSDIQEKVNVLYEEFASHVSGFRNLSTEAVIATQAKTFVASKAIELGLADKQMSLDEFAEYLADLSQPGVEMPLGNFLKSNKNEETLDMNKIEELQAMLESSQQKIAELSSVQESFVTLQSLFAEKETALTEALAQITQMQEVAAATKAQARKDKLSAVMAADQVDTMHAALSALDDDAFGVALAGFAAAKQKTEASELFNELGGDGVELEVVAPKKDAAKDNTEAALKQRLGIKD